jgi:fatty-acyl-CoA synthase
MSETIADILFALPPEEARGMRFITQQNEEHYYPWHLLRQQAQRIAANLQFMGVRKGDRIALVIAEQEYFMLGFLGTLLAGAVPVPMSSNFIATTRSRHSYFTTLSHIIQAADARMLLCMAADEDFLRQGLSEASRETVNPALLTIETLLSTEGGAFNPPKMSGSDLCFLQFTSGSTSMPKGAMVSHENVIANARAFLGSKGSLKKRDEDITLGWVPFYHDMGLMCFGLGPLVVDLPAVLLPTERFARQPWHWMMAISKYRASITFAPNFAFDIASRLTRERHLASMDLSRLRAAGCGSEPINPKVLRQFSACFAPAGLRETALMPCYGMAEATVGISFHTIDTPIITDLVDAQALRGGEALPAQAGSEQVAEMISCGHVIPEHGLKIVNSAGQALPERQVGEICFSGKSVTQGYYRNPEATLESYQDGWLRTGDLGYIAEGGLYICGRIKDLVIIHGVNYYPQDIEWIAAQAEGLRPNKVVAFSVMRNGQECLILCVEPNSYKNIEALKHALTEAVEKGLGLRISQVVVLKSGALALTSSGKVQRRKTKAMFENGELQDYEEETHEAESLA